MTSFWRSSVLTNSFAKSLLAVVFFCQFLSAQVLLCVQFYTGETVFPHRTQLPKALHEALELVKKDWVEEAHIPGVREFIESDSKGALNRIELFKELGFEWFDDGRVKVPDTYDFLVRYHNAISASGYGHKKYIRPALVFVKYRDPTKTEIAEYKLVDPFAKPAVVIPNGFVPLKRQAETFNLPYPIIMSGLKDGLFPLLGGMHDVSHYLGLRVQPEVGIAIVEAVSRLPETKQSIHFGRRLIALMEYSAFIPKNFTQSVQSYLAQRGITQLVSRQQIAKQLMSLSMSELLSRAKQSAEMFDRSLVDFGGAAISSWERIEDTNLLFKTSHFKTLLAYHQVIFKTPDQRVEDGLMGELETRYREYRYSQIIRAYPRFFSHALGKLAVKLAEDRREDFGWSFDMLSLRSRGLVQDKEKMKMIRGNLESRKFPEPTEAGEQFLKQMVVDFTSAIELQLSMATYGMSPAEMVKAMLQPALTEKEPLGEYFKQLYPGFIEALNFLDKPQY